MMKRLQSPWFAASAGIVIYLLMTWLAWPSARHPTQNSPSHAIRYVPSWDFDNPEINQLLAELKQEKKTMDQRHQQLQALAVRLKTERQEINQATQRVYQLQQKFDEAVVQVKSAETNNLSKLGKMYSQMSPDAAANILGEMDDDQIVRILVFMKDSDAAAILEALSKNGNDQAKRAATISERFRMSVVSGHNPKRAF